MMEEERAMEEFFGEYYHTPESASTANFVHASSTTASAAAAPKPEGKHVRLFDRQRPAVP